MKLVVDMNLSPDWVHALRNEGWEAVHWSTVGNPRAQDPEIMDWARQNACIVFTHDLDFGTLLALTNAGGPSVIQVRTQEITPEAIGSLVGKALRRFENELAKGALIIIDHARMRVRILPLNR